MSEKKQLAKRRKEEEKEARKRRHIVAKEKKEKLVSAVTTVERKLFPKTGVDPSCSSCHKTITSESGGDLCCDDCNSAFYEKCNPKYHKQNIPISEDGDDFLCHTCYNLKPPESRHSNEKWEEEESD